MPFQTDSTTEETELLRSDPRWQLVERVAGSAMFARATHLRAILIYIARVAISETGHSVREYEIACRVLGRRKHFDPSQDNIVRVQMTHLRRKLESYFASDGKQERLCISIPRGSYTPVFIPRAAQTQPLTVAPTDPMMSSVLAAVPETGAGGPSVPEPLEVEPREPEAETTAPPGQLVSWKMMTVVGLLCLVAGAVGDHLLRSTPRGAASAKVPAVNNPLLGKLFAPGATVNVVLADTSLVMLQNTMHTDLSVSQYLDESYPNRVLSTETDRKVADLLKNMTEHRFTSLNDADVVAECTRWSESLGATLAVRYARYMHVRDFEHENFVIVGSRRGNPWVSLFEPGMNFALAEDPQTHEFFFHNRRPRSGEAANYKPEHQPEAVEYVDIAVLPNKTGTGTVLLIDGFSLGANEAAANLIFRKDLPPELSRALAHPTSTRTEILLRVFDVDHAEGRSEIVVVRQSAD